MPHQLSKSKYIRGLQCDRALWLDVHAPRLARYTAEQMRRFDYGRDFEHEYKSTYPDGIDVSAVLGRNVDRYPAYTEELIKEKSEVVLFEAGFIYEDVLVLADVVCKHDDGGLDVYEIKSGTTLSDTYRRDAAIQHYVISHCQKVNKFSLVYNSPENGGFITEELTEELKVQHTEIAQNIASMKTIIQNTNEPETPTGAHCLEPYPCPYQKHCQMGVRQLALF